MRTALIILVLLGSVALLACGLETGAGPGKKDSGVTSGSGAGGGSGSNASPAGDGGDSGSTAGTGASGSSGRSGSSGGGSSGTGTGGTDDAGSGTGGTAAGTGGSSSSGCGGDTDCPADHPQCNADGQCGPCTSGSACEDRDGTEHCELSAGSAQGQCVQCIEAADCEDATASHCVNNTCVECETHADCADPAKPQCTAGTCTACTDAAACEGRAEGAQCVTDAGDAAAGKCVPCTEHSHCDVATPECGDEHVCAACTTNDACAGRAGTTICDLSSDAAFAGKCVQCTGTQYDGCGTDVPTGMPYVCDSLTRTCSSQPEHSRGPCKTCVSDAACIPGQKCVQDRFQSQNLGYVCLWTAGSAPGAALDSCVRPYVGARDEVTSIDGDTVDACGLRATTCTAQLDYGTQSCADQNDDAACGDVGLDDATCEQFMTSSYLCSTPCTSSLDCEPGYACNTDVTPKVCDLQPDRCYGDSDCASGATCQANHTCK